MRFALRMRVLAVMGTMVLCAAVAGANQLKTETSAAWDTYIAAVKADLQKRADGSVPFLWVSAQPNGEQRLQKGEILVARTAGDAPDKVPHGMIHDWTGAVFVPGVTLERAIEVLDNYDRYKDFYKPQVAESQLMERNTDNEKIRLLMVQSAYGVTAAVELQNDVQIVRPSATRAFTYSYSRHEHEIGNYGKPSQKDFPEDQGPGYVWRVFTATRLEERDGGVYIEEETIEMSRGIPIELRWMIKPLTERLARTIMVSTMGNTQKAITEDLAGVKEKPAAVPVPLH